MSKEGNCMHDRDEKSWHQSYWKTELVSVWLIYVKKETHKERKTQGKFWEKFTVTASKVIEKVLTFEDLKRVQDWCESSIWQMTVKLKVINIRPCLPGVINASVPEYSSMIFLMYKCTIAILGDHPPNLRSWSTWVLVKHPPFSMAAFRTNLVAKPCKRQKIALEPFTHGTNYTLLDADCVLTEKIGKSCKMEFHLWSVWIEVSSGISHSHLSMSHFSLFQVNHFGIYKGTQFCRSLCQLWQLEFILWDYHIDISA